MYDLVSTCYSYLLIIPNSKEGIKRVYVSCEFKLMHEFDKTSAVCLVEVRSVCISKVPFEL
jgi:hypothetical protein